MSLPTFTFEVAFPNAPFDTAPTWTDLAADMETLSYSRGRQTEADIAQGGACQGTLVDDSRKYDPNNAAGTYYPNVQPVKQLRVRATLDGTTYPQFRGWIDAQNGWIRDESEPGHATVSLPANDGFEWFTQAGTFDASGNPNKGVTQATGVRIVFMLNVANWPGSGGVNSFAGWRDIDYPGLETMQSAFALYGDSVPMLQAIRDAEATEPGFFYFDGSGAACFRNRRQRIGTSSAATFCDAANQSAGRVAYGAVTTRRTKLENVVKVDANGLAEQTASDAASIAAFMQRTGSYSTAHVTTDTALTLAQYRLNQRKDSYEVLESLTLTPGTDSPTWLQILHRELNDRITVVRTPPGGGAAVTRDYFIEAISIDYGPGPDASCTWRLSPASITDAWLAGTAGFSEAGTTTKAGY